MEFKGRWYAEGNKIFQEIAGVKIHVASVEIASEEADHYASLLAAAPELLDSLESMMRCKRNEFHSHFPKAYAKSRDVVKRALGNLE